ncbi:ABC transporter permease [Rhodococcoides corynebacterioides]|uniref:ABC transporter permease n=1 Tax=Rhodococcoides corynebacterioides TaxID=53972 RepID=A0ABS7P4M9_9NOCA|nr:ABC transporter permease [Rhodococcus corynebacterioides]MBY6367377.1 ABC transporter permease [Rhodococcus corynebacterioides]MBY6407661.1 ABC transporter permease [Rhodococcus corynebacterioides]
MSTVLAPPSAAAPARSRLTAVARVHAQNWQIAFLWPIGILAVIAGITWTVLALVPRGSAEVNTGGASFVFFFGLVLFAQSVNQFFPFVSGLGVTRWEFFRATTAVVVIHALLFGTLMIALSAVERVTDGFGVGMRLFSLSAPVAGSVVTEFAFFVTVIALANTVGVLAGAIYLRWRAVGMWATGLLATLALGVVVVVFTWQSWWVPVGTAIADAPRSVTMVLLPLALTALATPGVWAVLRRTTV